VVFVAKLTNSQITNTGGKLREVQNARMGRALQRLSAELYSRDTHFVLELVQNADDNAYPPGAWLGVQAVWSGAQAVWSGVQAVWSRVQAVWSKVQAVWFIAQAVW
jgi:hypothetical protein